MSIDWDIDSYKTEFETEEHWELKKRFMLAHKDKYPEDELVCLAQVFTNIEFMGCRYPEQTMKRVAFLAKGLVEDFREKKKNCLKRTFVAASDAASAKVKGLTARKEVKPTPDPDEPKIKSKKIVQTQANKPKKIKQSQFNKSSGNESKNDMNMLSQQLPINAVNSLMLSTFITQSFRNLGWMPNFTSVLNNFVVFYCGKNENPISVIRKSTDANYCHMSWVNEPTNSRGRSVTKLLINGELIAMGEAINQKQCKKITAKAALEKLKENCFGIRLNKDYRAQSVSNKDFGMDEDDFPNGLGKNNIGARLMLLMGWKGGGLGRKEQGIKEPITANMLAPREGFGLGSGSGSCSNNASKTPDHLKSFKVKAENFISNWLKSDPTDDLVFSTEFTPDERKELHSIAHSLCLKSKSQGKKNNRRLVISRRQHPLEIVQDLIKAGGTTSKFQLVYPSKLLNNISPIGLQNLNF